MYTAEEKYIRSYQRLLVAYDTFLIQRQLGRDVEKSDNVVKKRLHIFSKRQENLEEILCVGDL